VDEFRDAKPRLEHREQECVISAADPRGLIWRCEQSIDLEAGQEANEVAVKALTGDGEYTLDEGTMGWLRDRDEAEEGVDRGEAIVSSAGAIFPFRFQVMEKRGHERCINLREE